MGRQGERDQVVISDLKALRVIADPLRSRMLELLERPKTVRELAEHLDRPPDRLYYHLRLLEQHGLVRAADEGAGGERRYQLSAAEVTIDPGLNTPATTVDSLVHALLARVPREFTAGRRTRPRTDDGAPRSMLSLRHVRVTEGEREELTKLLQDVTDRFPAAEPGEAGEAGEDGALTFGIVTGIWPVT